LTERAAHLKDHAGQISLPGGRLAPGETPAAAALREAYEEVGLQPASVSVLGFLDPLLTGTGFAVTPVVGVVADAGFAPIPNPHEVAHAFELPLELLLHPSGLTIDYFERHDVRLRTYELRYQRFRIWGATAAILHHSREVILDDGSIYYRLPRGAAVDHGDAAQPRAGVPVGSRANVRDDCAVHHRGGVRGG
jgi:8-oxo-dGTP pyrophosphatase MutT (NUDIX family)